MDHDMTAFDLLERAEFLNSARGRQHAKASSSASGLSVLVVYREASHIMTSLLLYCILCKN